MAHTYSTKHYTKKHYLWFLRGSALTKKKNKCEEKVWRPQHKLNHNNFILDHIFYIIDILTYIKNNKELDIYVKMFMDLACF